MRPEHAVETRHAAVSVDADHDVADAHHAIGYVSGWVNNADTKAGLLAAALAVVIAGLTQQSATVGDVLRPGGTAEPIALVVLILLLATITVGIAALALVVIPRTPPPQAPSRFGFPTLSSAAWRKGPADRTAVAEEAWAQATVLASIASAKFKRLRVAAFAVFIAVGLSVPWLVTASLVK